VGGVGRWGFGDNVGLIATVKAVGMLRKTSFLPMNESSCSRAENKNPD